MNLLDTVQKGKKLKPLAIMFHAPRGIGKSTFASEAPNPVYVGAEENDELDVARFPKVKYWNEPKEKGLKKHSLEGQLRTLLEDDHDYKTLVIDTVDGLETVASKEFLKGKNAKYTIETYLGGYGKGGKEMAKMWEDLKERFIVPLRDKKGMSVVLLVHSKIRKHEDPMTGGSHDCFETAMHNGVKPVWESWVSAILFANYQLFKVENDKGQARVEGDGARMIYTEERPSHSAKNRFNFDEEIEFKKTGTWAVVRNAVLKHFAKKKVEAETTGEVFDDEAENIKKAINEKIDKVPKEVKPAIETGLGRAKNDVTELKRILAKIESMLK